MDVISLLSKRQIFQMPYQENMIMQNHIIKGASNGPRIHEFLQEMNRSLITL